MKRFPGYAPHLTSSLVGKEKRGLSLLEMSIVLTLVGTITAGSVMMGSSMIGSAQKASTNNKLDAIENALMGFRTGNNRLPCPADPTIIDSAANAATYGIEAGTPGTCTAANITSYTIPSTSATPNPSLGMVVTEGALPVRTLGLPDEFQFDGWGRKFTYAVTAIMTVQASATQSPAFISYGVQANCGAITVENAGHGNRTQVADYVLMSYGPDGHGGYSKSGTRTNAHVSNVDEIANAHYNNAGADTGLYAASYIQKDYDTYAGDSDAAHPFGHVLRYKERFQMQNTYDTYHPTSQLPCTQGFVAQAEAGSGFQLGWGGLTTGDINGDGIADLIIGGASNVVYVVFGTRNGFPDPLPLASLNGSNGFVLTGPGNGTNFGMAIAIGDINGDGIADLVIGAQQGNFGNGYAYVVFGKAGTWSASYDLSSIGSGHLLDGTQGVRFDSVCGTGYFGNSVTVGDVNGDGYADIIIGAYQCLSGNNYPGAAYVIYGKSGSWGSSGHVLMNAGYGDAIDGIQGFRLDGIIAFDRLGGSVVTGDVNGDGIADIIIDENWANHYSFVEFGKHTSSNPFLGSTTVNTTSGSPSATLASIPYGLQVGSTLNSANIPAGAVGTTISACGGGTVCTSTSITLSANATATASGTPLTVAAAPVNIGPGTFIDGTKGIRFDGAVASTTADINNDGVADILFFNGYIVFGKRTGWGAPAGNIVFNTGYGTIIDGIQGIGFTGGGGWAVTAGDLNGDGMPDIIMGGTPTSVVFNTIPLLPNTTINTTLGSGQIIPASYNGLMVGQYISSANIPAGTSIDGCSGGGAPVGTPCTSGVIYITANATATANGIPMYVATQPVITGTNAIEFDGVNGSDFFGLSVATGDINGDGIPDLIIAAPGAPAGAWDGYVYIYNGRKSGWPTSPFNLGGL